MRDFYHAWSLRSILRLRAPARARSEEKAAVDDTAAGR
jgi:hypothetical protein